MLKLIIVISTSHVRNNKYHETSRELSCWVELDWLKICFI